MNPLYDSALNSRFWRRSALVRLAGMLFVLTGPYGENLSGQEVPLPIQVVMDVHADPMPNGTLPTQQAIYQDWVAATNWALDVMTPRGAKISFLAVGGFMEWVLEDPAGGYPLMERLYASGGQIGTHSHQEVRFGVHDWRNLGPNPTAAQVLQQWNDHVQAVDAVIAAALGVSDPVAVRAINCSRGAHLPSDDAQRLQMMSDFGFTLHQQGPDEEFYAYFRHYPMNPFRPSSARFLQHDPAGLVVDVPFGPVLGKNDVHFGIPQDMRVPAVQGRFLLELLNWLHDVHVVRSGRLWVTGWGAHCSDLQPGQPSRNALIPALDWIKSHFVDQNAGGYRAAAFSSSKQCRDIFNAWEADHPGQPMFSYAPTTTDWDAYPYLVPAARYFWEAWYVGAMPALGPVRWHSLTASATAGGPYTMYVIYTTNGIPISADLSAFLGAGDVAAVNPAIGSAHLAATSAVPVPATGAILVPVDKVLTFAATGDLDADGDVDRGDYAGFFACFTGEGGGLTDPDCAVFDFDADRDIDLTDFAPFQIALTGP